MDVTIPSVGESVSEGTIGRWFVKDGDFVKKDDPLFELDSDKASMEVTAETSGTVKIMLEAGETAEVGSKVAEIDEKSEDASSDKKDKAKSASKSEDSKEASKKETPKKEASKEEASDKASPKKGNGRLDDAQEEVSKIFKGSTSASKVKEEDLDDLTPSQRKAVRSGKISKTQIKGDCTKGAGTDESTDEVRKPMTQIRKRIAERLMESQQTTATLTTFNEVDMTRVLEVRNDNKKAFQDKFGIKLGFMSFFSKAVLHAMKDYPIVNAHIEGNEIVEVRGTHLSIAVSTERGLVVPVIRNTESMTYGELEKAIADVAERAREGRLSIAEMQGGTFTLTNGGVFGSLLSTPILNPPQSAILGMHKTERRPVAVQANDGTWAMEVRPMMYLALSYDHRLIDGKTSVGFLVGIKEYLETIVSKDEILA